MGSLDFARFSLVTDTATTLPHTCDYMIISVAKFINVGISQANGQSTKVIRLAGDATYNESHQKLKKLRIGVLGTHFEDGEWRATFMPGIECLCHEENRLAVELTLLAFIHALQSAHGINLVDVVDHWFWDGHP